MTVGATKDIHWCFDCYNTHLLFVSAVDIHSLKIVHAAQEMAPPPPTNVVNFTVAPSVVPTASELWQFPQIPPCHHSMSSQDLLAYHNEATNRGNTLHKASSFTGNLTIAGNGFSSAPCEQGFSSSMAAPPRHDDPYRKVYIGT